MLLSAVLRLNLKSNFTRALFVLAMSTNGPICSHLKEKTTDKVINIGVKWKL